MKTTFDQVKQVPAEMARRWPLLTRSLALVLGLMAYLAGIMTVDALSGEARLPVIFFVVFFLPAILRAWLMVYWQLRREVRGLRRRHGRAGAH